MKFLVIEGLDGSGKSTQVKMLRQYLETENIAYEYLHFPRTVSPVYGDLIARFLRGDLGKIDEVHPYLVALLFAGDRHDAAKTIASWKSENKLVLVDRYVYSNIAYQCAKLKTESEQFELMEWILNTEYKYFNIPKPDINLFLKVPLDFVEARLSNQRQGDDRSYLQGKGDIHESDIRFQKKVRAVYELAMKRHDDITAVNCANEKGEMASADEIFSRIKAILIKNQILG
ncbi:MAG: dTMP kinase [Bacteroidales bacterium]|jgi:dTMP kinase|nr:dTMP kinase [Bacteroidales bacterium]